MTKAARLLRIRRCAKMKPKHLPLHIQLAYNRLDMRLRSFTYPTKRGVSLP